MTDMRDKRLKTLFVGVIKGQQNVTAQNSKRFLEAVCKQTPAVSSISRLVASSHGLQALLLALGADTSLPFLNGQFTSFVNYMREPELQTICGGEVVRQVLAKVAEAPILWKSLVEAARNHTLQEDALNAFGWLLVHFLSLPVAEAIPFLPVAEDTAVQKALIESSSIEIRNLGRRVVHIANTISGNLATKQVAGRQGPGGRHDNDFADIYSIAIHPTADELKTRDVYLPRACDVEQQAQDPNGFAIHIDGQFRLLREDMLRDLREELTASQQPKGRRRKPLVIDNLFVAGVQCDHRLPWSLFLSCSKDLPQFRNPRPEERKQFLKDHPKFLRHGFLACLFVGQEFVSLCTLVRDEDLLAQLPPVLCVQLPPTDIDKVLMQLKDAGSLIRLLQVDTAIFTYEPVLKQLKETRELLLMPEIVAWQDGNQIEPPEYDFNPVMEDILFNLCYDHSFNLQTHLGLAKPTKLDKAQAECFRAAIQQRVVVIQGPPGTGKSFIGSLVAKAIHRLSDEKILIVCYTHHALDDFLEGILAMGIPEQDIIRLGSTKKATPRTKTLALKENSTGAKLTRDQWEMVNTRKTNIIEHAKNLNRAFDKFFTHKPNLRDLLAYLEFLEDDLPFYDALKVPSSEDGMTRVKRGGKKVNETYLLERWLLGEDAGIYSKEILYHHRAVWKLPREIRDQKWQQWYYEMSKELVVQVREAGKVYNDTVGGIESVYLEKDLWVMRQKRIIACTTTAAAKYSEILRCIAPGVLLVEEAGEILESHVLTALGPETKHLILIGDHKQLRPKVNYELSVEKGTGYDLNRSLFERLILKHFPHQTLFAQHRMRPEISSLVRRMTYPELEDAADTKGRPDLRGFTDNIIFVNHKEFESELTGTRDLGDSTSSKQNHFEAYMTLRCVRYLGQQGYKTDDIVVLTPYLGQLRLLLDVLKTDNDPVLNDLDSHDLVRAGLMPDATANVNKPRLRISTIDNFQGEEANIVVASLTRSNETHEIGFMSAPERLNVLISRARNALILIGNAEHFMGSRKGGELWTKFIGMLKDGMHVYDGFPVCCQRHPDRKAILQQPRDFDTECPDGGCKEPCDKMLNCGIHKCPDKCHILYDHSKIKCTAPVETKCANGHNIRRKCHAKNPEVCHKCEAAAKKAREEAERKLKAQEEEQKHLLRMADLDLKIQAIRDEAARQDAAQQRAAALKQKEADLQAAKALALKKQAAAAAASSQAPSTSQTNASQSAQAPTAGPSGTSSGTSAGPSASTEGEAGAAKPDPDALSPAEADWERQKKIEGASNDAIDALMSLTGLEEVKEKVLDIKSKIETVALQGTDVSKERFGVTMLGNPGTGKTTVARIYGKFLASVDAIPGSEFVEVSGSSLANDGVSGAKKKIEDLVKEGGGVFFLDEAYQLASGNSYGGKAVLDYLLAEIEERRGTIVFILAGYKKEMEAFFEHNPGFGSRVPHQLIFEDYSDEDLLKMLCSMIDKKYKGQAKLEDGPTGLYARILIRRQGRRRGTRDYGNARDLENTWARVTERQAARLRRERRNKNGRPDPLFFSKTDLIGPEPSVAIKHSKAYRKLHELIGLSTVKEAIQTLISRISVNYERELKELPVLEVSLNRLFLGSPGTGKTTVAKLYGAILAEIGLLSKGEVVNKTPADFIGAVLGESEKNTKAILQASTGKVLLIDEAYSLNPTTGSIGGASGGDPYKTAAIDTIVAEVQSVPGEDRCVLLLGYTDKMKEMLRNANPGLSRRFPLDSAFIFEDYDDDALRLILEQKMKAQGVEATDEAEDVAIGLLARLRDRPNFGNAGEVENMLSRAKDAWQKRQGKKISGTVKFEPQDFDKKFDRAKKSDSSVQELFSDIVGLDKLVEQLESYQKRVVNLKARGKDPREVIPFNFVFKGPPGTGKTTVARRIAKFYYNIGILPTDEYTDCSAADCIAAYVGQSAPKTKEVLRSALGKVLFIDEAYRLQDGEFGKEAVNEIVDCLTKPDFLGKLVVILAGYTDDMNDLLRVNPGLSSRFPEEVFFESLSPERCVELLCRVLVKSDLEVAAEVESPNSPENRKVLEYFAQLRELPSWGSGRDVNTLAKKIIGSAFENAEASSAKVKVSAKDILSALEKMLQEQTARSEKKPARGKTLSMEPKRAVQAPGPMNAPNISTASSTAEAAPKIEPPREQAPDGAGGDGPPGVIRDPGVSDQVWEQLQRDMADQKHREEQRQAQLERQKKELEQAKLELAAAERQILIAKLRAEQQAKDAEEQDRRLRELEQARIRAIMLQRAREEEELRLNALREAQLRERKREQEAQRKLRSMGVCVAGYQWIKQSNGYRCAGGSHFVSDAQLGL